MSVHPGGLSQDVALGSIWLVPRPGRSGLIVIHILFPYSEQGEAGVLHWGQQQRVGLFQQGSLQSSDHVSGHPPSAAPRGASEAVRGGFEADLGGGALSDHKVARLWCT